MVDYYKDEINDHKQKIKDIEKLEEKYMILKHEISQLNTKERRLMKEIKILMKEIEHPKLYL